MQATTPNRTQGLHERRSRAIGAGRGDDVLVICLLIGVGLLPIVLAGVRGESWGVEPTLGMLIALFALKQLAERFKPRIRAWRRLMGQRRACGGRFGSEH